MIEPFQIHVDDAVLDDLRSRLAQTRFPDQIDGHRLGVRDPGRLPARAGRVLARRRTTGGRRRRGSTSSPTSAPTIDGQPIHFVHARSPHADAFPLLHHARLARLDRRVPRRHPAAPRPDDLPRGRAVAAGLRVLGAPAHRGLGHVAHRPRVRRADGPARLRALRRAGWRLGRAGRDPDRRARSRALRRHPPQHGDRRPARRTRSSSPTRTRPTSPRWRTSSAEESGYAQRAVDQAADARRRPERLTGRPARVDRREVPHVERLRRPPRERLHPRSAASPT